MFLARRRSPTLETTHQWQGQRYSGYGLLSPKVKKEVAGGDLDVTSRYINSFESHEMLWPHDCKMLSDLSIVLLIMALRYQNRKMMDQ